MSDPVQDAFDKLKLIVCLSLSRKEAEALHAATQDALAWSELGRHRASFVKLLEALNETLNAGSELIETEV